MGNERFIGTPNGVVENVTNGQHILERHVGWTDQELINRMSSSNRITGASTFTNDIVMNNAVTQALNNSNNQNIISNWLNNPIKNKQLIEIEMNSVIGRGVYKNDLNNITDLTKARVVLKINGVDREFDFLTAYPQK